ncbi:hypothetical protein DM01DRAFT_1332339 [Hesseltinella vesiculosa]|uniref:SB domain-containing protein n=1 Tax=Hesseltinella vesiculosa TaxID=101127 RepID=A0A1X2GUQ2_9FUNG|nr:hypothetical protein DM01DRAFT_1332339 [Hesseltinella vesiculosa]
MLTQPDHQINRSGWQDSTAFYNLSQDMAGLTMSPAAYTNNASTTAPSTPTTATAVSTNPTPVNHPESPYLAKSSSLPAIANNYPSAKVEETPQEQLSRKVAEHMQSFQLDISKDMDDLLNVNRQLNDGEVQLQNEMHMLQDIHDRLQANMSILESRSKDLDQVIDKVTNMPDVSVDEALSGTTVVYNQLFELVADDNAIVDSIYYLGKALNTERIDLTTFMKCTRKLAREQFMKRALIKKISESS